MGKNTEKQKPFVGVAVRFKGIGYAATVLGCNPYHLRSVLRGDRVSKRLTDKVRKQFPELLVK